jgi:cytidine deaminase
MIRKRLVKAARAVRLHSYSPYSRFRVGAAVLTKSGKIFAGCNIENSSYGLTVCAERTALFKAVSEGHRRFVALAIATDGPDFVSPCGACRQVIQDLAGDVEIILCTRNGRTKTMRLADLFPHPFALKEPTSPKKR